MKKFWTLAIGVLLVVGGFLLLLNPEQSFSKLILLVGIALILTGVYKILFSLLNKDSLFLPGNTFLSGFVNAIFGLILILNTDLTVKVLTTFIGLWLILSSVFSLAWLLNFKSKNEISQSTLFNNIIKLIFGIIVLVTPIISVLFTGIFLGFFLIILGVITIFNYKKEEKIYKVKIKK